jgi:hypothetical protein
MDLATAALAYYTSLRHWPTSPTELRALRTEQLAPEVKEEFLSSVRRISWEEVGDRVTFNETGTGSLNISLPPLDPPWQGGACTVTVQKPETARDR